MDHNTSVSTVVFIATGHISTAPLQCATVKCLACSRFLRPQMPAPIQSNCNQTSLRSITAIHSLGGHLFELRARFIIIYSLSRLINHYVAPRVGSHENFQFGPTSSSLGRIHPSPASSHVLLPPAIAKSRNLI